MSVVSVRLATSTQDLETNGPAWRPFSDEEERTGATVEELMVPGEKVPKALISCPGGHVGVLRTHSVAPDGSVSPSVVCHVGGCNWHVFVRLEKFVESQAVQ